MAEAMEDKAEYIPESFDFELLIDGNERYIWMKKHWHYSIYLSVAYLMTIYTLKRYMRTQTPFELRKELVLWNTLMFMFSLVVTVRILPIFWFILSNFGFNASVCDPGLPMGFKTTMFWSWFFLLSKVLELGDTIFLLLRKKELQFLHVYHHALTLIMSWYSSGQKLAITHWFMVMNAIVHSFMYAYFAVMATKLKIPGPIALAVTSLQILQMLVGSVVIGWAFIMQDSVESCHLDKGAMTVALFAYVSYGYLFSNLFYKRYFSTNKKRKSL